MGKFADVCARKPKHIRSKKKTLAEKRKLITKKKTSFPEHAAFPESEIVAAEHEIMIAEPAVPKKSRFHKKKEAQKEKGIVIREGTPEAAKSPLVQAGDKDKEIMREL